MQPPEKDNLSEYVIFHINGSPEKDLIATSVVNSLKELSPNKKILVVSNFPEIWLHNPDVFQVYRLGVTPYFYDTFIKDKNTQIYAHDPYLHEDYIYEKKPVAQIWCEMIGIKHNGSKPQLHLTQREEEVALKISHSSKPILLIHGNDTFSPFPALPYNWAKDLPISVLQKIADHAIQKGYDIIQVRTQNNPPIIGAVTLGLNLRMTLALIKNIKKLLLIDSFLVHVAEVWDKTPVVTWLSTTPLSKGYETHTNILGAITPIIGENLSAYSPLFDVKGELLNQPITMDGVYSSEEILKALHL